ncbi:unnamed protein product [Prorocentrum cordatum]|uniref:Uncharacterized protein n=1 Tax=Prorocentrum cordatum TaxID=2364126 RepID=A0ABN9UQW9_9DINO|nr:unnamed protein product [Polarella glacialis]
MAAVARSSSSSSSSPGIILVLPSFASGPSSGRRARQQCPGREGPVGAAAPLGEPGGVAGTAGRSPPGSRPRTGGGSSPSAECAWCGRRKRACLIRRQPLLRVGSAVMMASK